MTAEKLMQRIVAFRDRRDWQQFHTKENLAKSVSIEAGELLELFQWGEKPPDDKLADEIADVLIYCFLLAKEIGRDPLALMEQKLARNEERFPVDRVRGNNGKATRVDPGVSEKAEI
ncbi:NTP pyrophosphatase, house-cleaning of non-canonical NTPs [Alkalispirochaeta americana]|uniref:NTP pyrophosphatase, house-cleaning of non-canonical NTPs n=1 Tax=Alkalispirochaeta americana TaxID=159291 RepID=A0A1N6RF61_9SPIO|nr:nucleotide pyrophosphohydrolase [Alkalispirochaeta americana]SIQ27447.1 NTP pyrophosphatase, house-cleaning of non-canonical NTPs [Alkalispirochaeta americana]